MKHFIFSISILIFCTSCMSKKERELHNALNQSINLDMFKKVYSKDTVLNFRDFRKQYKYISVVYLLNGCQTCYQEFIDWQKKMELIKTSKDYTVLFIIRGDSYEKLMSNIKKTEPIENNYYVIMDPTFKYINETIDIPKWIRDSSPLIDKENKIKMIGKPWINKNITELFYRVCEI